MTTTQSERQGLATDAVLMALGQRGRYQAMQILLMMLTNFAFRFQLFEIIFLGATVAHECAPNPNVANYSYLDLNYTEDTEGSEVMVYEQCRQGVSTNASNSSVVDWQPCQHGWRYHQHKDATIVSEFDLVCERGFLSQLSQTLFTAGQAMGALLFPALSDRLGRRPVVVWTHLSMVALAVALSFSPSYLAFAAIRLVIGAFQQGVAMGANTYILELLVPQDRRLMGLVLMVVWGVVLLSMLPVAFLLRHHSWRTLELAFSSVGVIAILQLFFQDESLRWLIANGRVKETHKLLRKAAAQNGKDLAQVQAAFQQAMEAGEGQEVPTGEEGRTQGQGGNTEVKKYTLLDIFRHWKMASYLLVFWVIWFIDSMAYYALYLTSGFLHKDKYINFLLNALADFPSAFLFYLFIDRIGRRYTMMLYHVFAAVALLSIAVIRRFLEGATVEVVSTVLGVIGKLAVSSAFDALYFYTPEIFPTNLRNLGTGTSSMAARVGGMLAPFSEKLADVFPWAPGTIMGSCCVLVTALLLRLPETRGRTLPSSIEEVEAWGRSMPPRPQPARPTTALTPNKTLTHGSQRSLGEVKDLGEERSHGEEGSPGAEQTLEENKF